MMKKCMCKNLNVCFCNHLLMMHICKAIDYGQVEIEIDEDASDDLSQLPDTTSILYLCGEYLGGKCFKYLPRNLRELYIRGYPFYANGDDLKQLPAGLRVFHVYGENTLAGCYLKYLPPSVYDISFIDDEPGYYSSTKYLEYFPRTLRKLSISMYMCLNEYIGNSIKSYLPYLKELTLNTDKITNDLFDHLPETLTTLDITGRMRLRSGWSELIPENLKEITFHDSGISKTIYRDQLFEDRMYFEGKLFEIFYEVAYYIDVSEYHPSDTDEYFTDYDYDYSDDEFLDDRSEIDIDGENIHASAA